METGRRCWWLRVAFSSFVIVLLNEVQGGLCDKGKPLGPVTEPLADLVLRPPSRVAQHWLRTFRPLFFPHACCYAAAD